MEAKTIQKASMKKIWILFSINEFQNQFPEIIPFVIGIKNPKILPEIRHDLLVKASFFLIIKNIVSNSHPPK